MSSQPSQMDDFGVLIEPVSQQPVDLLEQVQASEPTEVPDLAHPLDCNDVRLVCKDDLMHKGHVNSTLPEVISYAGFDGTTCTSPEQPLFDGASPEGLPDPQEPGTDLMMEPEDISLQVSIHSWHDQDES